MAQIFDKRSDFFKAFFDKALKYDDFLLTGSPSQRDRWLNLGMKLKISPAQKSQLSGYKRKMNILVLSGIWCGDCARQCPMIDLIAKHSSVIDCRFIDNEAYPELRDELRIAGGSRVPVALILSEDFFEIARFGDRHLSVYRKKFANELGAACDPGLLPPPEEELSIEFNEWFELIEHAQLVLRLSPFLRTRHKD